jgi:hypothetical protein
VIATQKGLVNDNDVVGSFDRVELAGGSRLMLCEKTGATCACLAFQSLELGAHSRFPDSLLRVFRYAQGIAGGEGCILVV